MKKIEGQVAKGDVAQRNSRRLLALLCLLAGGVIFDFWSNQSLNQVDG